MKRWIVRLSGPLLVAAAFGAASCSGGSAVPVPSDPTLAKGQEMYNARCASCHGNKGQGVSAPQLIGIAQRYPDIEKQIAKITNGVKGTQMPAWQGTLSPEEIRAVAQYTRTLQ